MKREAHRPDIFWAVSGLITRTQRWTDRTAKVVICSVPVHCEINNNAIFLTENVALINIDQQHQQQRIMENNYNGQAIYCKTRSTLSCGRTKIWIDDISINLSPLAFNGIMNAM